MFDIVVGHTALFGYIGAVSLGMFGGGVVVVIGYFLRSISLPACVV